MIPPEQITLAKQLKDVWKYWAEGLITRQERNAKMIELVTWDIAMEAQRCYVLLDKQRKKLDGK